MGTVRSYDVLVHGMFGDCDYPVGHFPGKSVHVSCESLIGSRDYAPRFLGISFPPVPSFNARAHYIGPMGGDPDMLPRGMQVFCAPLMFNDMGVSMRRDSPGGNKFLMYAASNCVALRELVFDRIVQKMAE
eukprot:g5931.t1